MDGRIIVHIQKISTAERSWTNPLNTLQGAIRYSFIKFCIYCFPLWYEFFVHYVLRVEKKKFQHDLDAGPLEFQFLRPRGCSTNPFRILLLCLGAISKTPGLISRNNFVKKNLSSSAIAVISWQDVARSFLCSGVKQGLIKLFGAPRQWKHFRPLFQAVFLLGGGYYPPDSQTPRLPVPRQK